MFYRRGARSSKSIKIVQLIDDEPDDICRIYETDAVSTRATYYSLVWK